MDLDLEAVKVYRLEEGHYVRAAELSREYDDVLTSSLLPDFHLALADLFKARG